MNRNTWVKTRTKFGIGQLNTNLLHIDSLSMVGVETETVQVAVLVRVMVRDLSSFLNNNSHMNIKMPHTS